LFYDDKLAMYYFSSVIVFPMLITSFDSNISMTFCDAAC